MSALYRLPQRILQTQIKALERAESIDNLAKKFANLGVESKQSAEYLVQLQDGLKDVGASTVEISRATRAFQEYERAAESAKNATKQGLSLDKLESAGSRLSRGLRGVGLTGAGDAVDFGSDALQSVLSAKDAIASIAPSAGAAVAALGPFIPVLAGVAVVAGAATIAQKRYNDELKAGQERLNAALDAQSKYYTAVHTLTSEQAKKAIEDEKVNLRIQNDIAGENRDAINRAALDAFNNGTLSKATFDLPQDQRDVAFTRKR